MINDFIQFLFKKNGKTKTLKDLFIVGLVPWCMFVFALATNQVAALLRAVGVHTQHISLRVTFVGCAIFSVCSVIIYCFQWWKIYRKN